MLIEEEVKAAEVNPDAIEEGFEEDILVEEEVVTFALREETEDEVDIAFNPNDEGYW